VLNKTVQMVSSETMSNLTRFLRTGASVRKPRRVDHTLITGWVSVCCIIPGRSRSMHFRTYRSERVEQYSTVPGRCRSHRFVERGGPVGRAGAGRNS